MSVVEHRIRIITELSDEIENMIPDSMTFTLQYQEGEYLIRMYSLLMENLSIKETLRNLSEVDGVSRIRYEVISIQGNIHNTFEYNDGKCISQELGEYFTKHKIECEKCGQDLAIMYDRELEQSICVQCEEIVLYERFGS